MRKIVIEHPNHRMKFNKDKFSSGFQEMIYYGGPGVEIGQPANGAIGGEYNIKILF